MKRLTMKIFSNSLKRARNVQAKLKKGQWALVQQKANLRYLDFAKADFLLLSPEECFYFTKSKSESEKLWLGEKTLVYEQGTSQESKNILPFLKKLNFDLLYTDLNIFPTPNSSDYLHHEICSLSTEYPAEKLSDLTPLIAPLRMIKDAQELDNIKRANSLTKKAIDHLQHFLISGVSEYELKAEFDYFLAKKGVLEQAFTPIIACDSSSCVLHKQGYKGKLQNNVLFDLGAKYKNYCADISRSYFLQPSLLQEKALLMVHKAQTEVIAQAKPGMSLQNLNGICQEILSDGLLELGIITKKSQLRDFFMHSVSHHLGLETHDLSLNNLPLQKNMVITVEPGLYFWHEGFGIRIEDDIIITKSGAELI